MAIQKLTGSETEYVLEKEYVPPVAGKIIRVQGHILEIVALMEGFRKRHQTLPIKGRREVHNVLAELEKMEERVRPQDRIDDIRRIDREIERLLSTLSFDPTEGLATATGGRIYMEIAGPYPEGNTPQCALPSEVILQERMLDCALAKVAREISTGEIRYHLYRNSSDGKGHSQGNHTSVMYTMECQGRLFARRHSRRHYTVHDLSHEMQDLMSWMVLRLWIIGSGKPGSEHPYGAVMDTHYQVSQRSDFVTGGLVDAGTMHDRPLINCRDESLCDKPWLLARFHDIHSEGSNRSPLARKLCLGLTQVVFAMIEDDMFGLEWHLADPLNTLPMVSRDLTLLRPIPVVLRRNGNVVQKMPLELLADIAKRMSLYAKVTPLHKELLDCIGEFERIAGLFGEDSPELSKILDWKIKEKFIRLKMKKIGLNPDNPRHWSDFRVQQLHIKYHCLTDERLWKAVVGVCKVKDAEKYFEENVPGLLSPPDTTSAFLKGFLVAHPYLSRWVDIHDWHVIDTRVPGYPEMCIRIDPRIFHKAEVTELKNGLGMINTPDLAHEFFSRIIALCKEPTRRSTGFSNDFKTSARRGDGDDDDEDYILGPAQVKPPQIKSPQITQLHLGDARSRDPRDRLGERRYGGPDDYHIE